MSVDIHRNGKIKTRTTYTHVEIIEGILFNSINYEKLQTINLHFLDIDVTKLVRHTVFYDRRKFHEYLGLFLFYYFEPHSHRHALL